MTCHRNTCGCVYPCVPIVPYNHVVSLTGSPTAEALEETGGQRAGGHTGADAADTL